MTEPSEQTPQKELTDDRNEDVVHMEVESGDKRESNENNEGSNVEPRNEPEENGLGERQPSASENEVGGTENARGESDAPVTCEENGSGGTDIKKNSEKPNDESVENGEDEQEKDSDLEDLEDAEEEKSKGKKRKREDLELDEEDLELVQENLGITLKRAPLNPNKRRRLKKKSVEDKAKQIENLLFSDEEEPEEEVAQEKQRDEAEPGAEGSEVSSESEEFSSSDEMADWIVEGEVDAEGVPLRRQKRKKKGRGHRQYNEITQQQLREASAIFGDMDDFIAERQRGDEEDMEAEPLELEEAEGVRRAERGRQPVDKLELIQRAFEPSVLAEKFYTAEDDRIRNTDLPERHQLRMPRREPPAEGELAREAEWIFEVGFEHKKTGSVTRYIDQLISLLEFLRQSHYEVPFIARYRKDYYMPEFTADELWEIYDLDERWSHIVQRKATLRQLIEAQRSRLHADQSAAAANEGTPSSQREQEDFLDMVMQQLELAKTEQQLSDLFETLQLHCPTEPAPSASRPKRPARRDPYSLCVRVGVPDFAKQFGISVAAFAKNLSEGRQLNEPPDAAEEPEAAAQRWLDAHPPARAQFSEPKTLLAATRSFLAQELAVHPFVRKTLRQTYEKYAEVTIKPTLKGVKEIDMFHPLYPVRRLGRKSIAQFHKSIQFLLINKAEAEGFITTKIAVPEEEHQQNFHELEGLFLSTSTHSRAQQWNNERRQVLAEALSQHLYPLFERETRRALTEAATKELLSRVAQQLSQRVMAGPYRPPENSERGSPEEEGVRVLACGLMDNPSANPARQAVLFVMVDPDGELVDSLQLDNLFAVRQQRTQRADTTPPTTGPEAEAYKRREADIDQLASFIMHNKPHVIAISAVAGQLAADRLAKDLGQLITRENWRTKVHCTFAPSDVARIYAVSKRGLAEFPEESPLLRQCVSTARLMQDPLTEIAGLFTVDNDMMGLKFHPLQDTINRDELRTQFERVMVNAVNAVGVDLNRALLFRHAFNTLQFVAGLGPRKATGFLEVAARKDGKIHSRVDLLNYFGPKVFTNAAGFLRIREKYFRRNEALQVLDDTRIHPDDYEFARKMALDALSDDPHHEIEEEYVIDEVMAHPKKLDDIDLDSFAEEWEKKGKGKKRLTLYDIKAELTSPFADPRKPYKDPTKEEVFYMLSGESEATLRKGQLITVQVMRFVRDPPPGVLCKLDNGLSGWLPDNSVSDSDVKTHEVLAPGMSLTCRVCDFDYDRLEVVLSSRGSDLCDKDGKWAREYLQNISDIQLENEETAISTAASASAMPEAAPMSEAASSAANRAKRVRKTRKILHPAFKNFTYSEAEQYLREKEVGEVVVRPSSKGDDHLTLSWKFADGVVVHTDIIEHNKPTPQALGRELEINKEKFEDLNEILARYLDPIVAFCKEVYDHRSFRRGTKEEIAKLLQEEKTANPNRIPYYIGVAHNAPGKFVLYYLPSRSPKYEFISVVPNGFILRQHRHRSVDDLISWFKKHYKDPIPQHLRRSQLSGGAGSGAYDPEQTSYGYPSGSSYNTQTPAWGGAAATAGGWE